MGVVGGGPSPALGRMSRSQVLPGTAGWDGGEGGLGRSRIPAHVPSLETTFGVRGANDPRALR